MNPYDIIQRFYPQDTPLRRLLILHSEKVRDKAFELLESARRANGSEELDTVDEHLINDGALLHDIGIGRTHAPGILCEGIEPYICHGILGAQMLREMVAELQASKDSSVSEEADYLERLARICERHTGAGLTVQDIVQQNLPIVPARDLLPETIEEKLVCLADKFYSKSGDPACEKSLERVRRSMMKFGAASEARFEDLCRLFSVN